MKKLLFLLTLFTFAGCVAVDSPIATRPDPITVNLQNETQQKIRSLESQGDYYAAAREYMRLASLSNSPQKEDYQLSAIEAYLKGNLLVEARLELARVNIQATPLLATRYELLTARLEVAEGQTEAGLQRLARIVPTAAQQAQYSEVKALAYEKKGEMLTALQERMVLDKQLRSDPNAQSQNHQKIWQTLMNIPAVTLGQLSKQATGDLDGWVMLALYVRNVPADRLSNSLAQWKQKYSNHPATDILAGLSANGSNANNSGTRIALLLPLSGQFKPQGEAIRDGFLAAWYADNTAKPLVDIYDTNPQNILDTYQQLIKAGVKMVIGPVDKESINKLLNQYSPLPIPMLALNTLSPQPPARIQGFYQFGLSPEDEAELAAQKAWETGKRFAAILAPVGAWGDRMVRAYQQAWENMGGQVKTIQRFDKNINNVAKLAATSGADTVLLAAYPTEGRQIPPFVRYNSQTMPLSIFATSTIYANGTANPSLDKDLNDVVFCDMPWILTPNEDALNLQNTLQQYWSNSMSSFKRVFAFGVDVYRLTAQLLQEPAPTIVQLQGQSGNLSLNGQGVVKRQLLWAQFMNGAPALLTGMGLPSQ